MHAKIGLAEGTCSRCGRTLRRQRPADLAVCDCYVYCPFDHGQGEYMYSMMPYAPDLTPSTYGPIESEEAIGDTEKPLQILYYCPVHRYYSAQKPVEVRLS